MNGTITKDNELIQKKFMRYEFNVNKNTMAVFNCMTNKYVIQDFTIDYECFRTYVKGNEETNNIGVE